MDFVSIELCPLPLSVTGWNDDEFKYNSTFNSNVGEGEGGGNPRCTTMSEVHNNDIKPSDQTDGEEEL